MADETAAQKSARELTAAADKKQVEEAEKAKIEEENQKKIEEMEKAGLAANAKRQAEEEAAKDSSTSGFTSSPQAPAGKAPSLLDQILAETQPEPTFVPTYNLGRWKVGIGHSMVDVWVEGEEVDLTALLSVGRTEDETKAILQRLIGMGAIVRMADHEPKGGEATGRLAPLNASVQTFNQPVTEQQIRMGSDMRERIAGQATPQEVSQIMGSRS
jgi:hypothetical protein